jgi:hypothetical protein
MKEKFSWGIKNKLKTLHWLVLVPAKWAVKITISIYCHFDGTGIHAGLEVLRIYVRLRMQGPQHVDLKCL